LVPRNCEGRVVIVTGGARGIGRAEAVAFAQQGAKVVVNDLGAELDGTGNSSGPAGEVVDVIREQGGTAVANGEDVSSWEGAGRLVQAAVDQFGRLDVVVNNAGILRDRMLVNMTVEDWDAVMAVHLRGTFGMAHHAARYWRDQKKSGHPVDARLINTSSAAGLFGNLGQVNYSAAKAGICAFTLTAAAELGRYGATVNAVAPGARTRMTEGLFAGVMDAPESGFDAMSPENIAPLVVWLGSTESAAVTGRVFGVSGDRITVQTGWTNGPSATNNQARWDQPSLGPVIGKLLAQAPEAVPVIGTAASGISAEVKPN
jgi:NAD(P)-dependent dehydrogenase (short-subunit alcohol dehydrogenase family)